MAILLFQYALLVTSCATVSQQQEVAIGQANAEQIDRQLPIIRDPAIMQYINTLGNSMAKLTPRADLDWHFAVVNASAVNAFALPGGYIYVNRGLIDHTERMDELAGVLGHEIGHVVLRHSVKQMQQMQGANIGVVLGCVITNICDDPTLQTAVNAGAVLTFAKFSRDDERQADDQGVINTVRAGISPEGLPAFFQKLLALGGPGASSGIAVWFQDHPGTQDRIDAVQQQISRLPQGQLANLRTDESAFHEFKSRLSAIPPPPPSTGKSGSAPP
jgi:beta-barrel assembly-enhancing protease